MASSARIDELRKKFDENPRRYFAPLANEYRKAGDLEQAIFICQEYLPQQPGHMSGHIVYGQALFELNRHDEAKAVFETALSLDPENLIALRHLGDIARQSGDAAAARGWYQRVLEADPRNEEIAQLLQSLAAPAAPAVDHNAPTPLHTPAVPAAIASPPAVPPVAPVAPAAHQESSESSFDMHVSAPVASPPLLPPPIPTPATAHRSANAPKDEDLLDLDNFDLGGVPLSEMRKSAAAPVPDEAPAVESNEPFSGGSADAPGDITNESDLLDSGFDIPSNEAEAIETSQAEDVAFEADPFAIAAVPARPATDEPIEATGLEIDSSVELATDLVIGLPDDGLGAPPPVDADAMDGLQSFEAGVLPLAPLDAPVIETASFYEFTAEPVGSSPDVSEAMAEQGAEPEAPAAFVTETMATLYLEQGHIESAIEIYRQLIEQRPDDAGLRERLAEVEARSPSVHDTAVPEVSADLQQDIDEPIGATASPADGPTIREFLGSLFGRRTPIAVEPIADATPDVWPIDGTSTSEAAEPSIPESSWETPPSPTPAAAQEPAPRTSGARPTPSIPSETVGGSLDVLFSGADAAASDAAAASALAEAFAPDGPETAPLQGVPAHRASSELSLDHVFKAGSPSRPSDDADGFSFDQFFSNDAAEASSGDVDTPPGSAPPATDDIAQFNTWLNGLKKT
jgi:tetratricopeptide (TPR) repeat protein